MIRAVLLLSAFALPVAAQEIQQIPGAEEMFSGEDDGDIMKQDWENGILIPLNQDEPEETRERVAQGSAAVLRGLDKLTGDVRDLEIGVGQTQTLGRIEVTLSECRYPEANPVGNAYAYLTIRERGDDAPAFTGWMVAASPALNPMEHPRYDVWVMRCTT
ncbi:DUF2155 domain-containing protein [Palleronia abyssalis]|uniref:DUF2155 domain-containing protein n=1 Tax=Palleronia abyssalis TaxID=1501240 RepID=A0A2R8BV81_9RHOB|nr:DUF2155 domain-containing protein [Palleronia abyssalis]SPJ24062.1 hypothetical protein PAA8504_01887 [Palleronia abyssalis]